MKRAKNKPTRRHDQTQLHKHEPEKLPFIAHVYELRKRLFYIAASVGLFSVTAAGFQSQLTNILLKPANGQQFIYTSPGGGFDFAFRLCLYTGVALSIPVIVYQILRYLEPLAKKQTMKFFAWFSICSGVMACIGIVFAYFVGLPAGLHFLLQGFSTKQIQALISIQSYLSFVMVYLLGSALLFQIPLIMLFINRIKRLKPRKLMKLQRWVILTAFVLGAIISPSPDIRNQALLSGPIIAMYEFSIIMIWFINRKYTKPKKVAALLQKDAEARAERLARFEEAKAVWKQIIQEQNRPLAEPPTQAQPTVAAPVAAIKPSLRPQQYVQEFSRQPRRRIIEPMQQTD
jgi:sec-independent protein translocase protein TatC